MKYAEVEKDVGEGNEGGIPSNCCAAYLTESHPVIPRIFAWVQGSSFERCRELLGKEVFKSRDVMGNSHCLPRQLPFHRPFIFAPRFDVGWRARSKSFA